MLKIRISLRSQLSRDRSPPGPHYLKEYTYMTSQLISSNLESEFVTLEERNNSLLNRQETTVVFSNLAGKVKRMEAAQILARSKNIDAKNVFPMSLKGETGKANVRATFYIYDNPADSQDQLPRYRILRNLPRIERKKLIEEDKSEKLKAKQATASGTKTLTGKGKK